MERDRLAPVLRLRQLARDTALNELAAALAEEAAAMAAVAALEAEIARETEAAAALTGDDAVVEAFGRWLREARRALGTAEARRDEASAEVGLARAVLAASRAAMEAAEALAARRQDEARLAALRGEQHALDELAARDRTDKLPD
jgi:flagellar export protein FliJ